jgi:predicted Fe-S protein YdhL (DUF1289 family)
VEVVKLRKKSSSALLRGGAGVEVREGEGAGDVEEAGGRVELEEEERAEEGWVEEVEEGNSKAPANPCAGACCVFVAVRCAGCAEVEAEVAGAALVGTEAGENIASELSSWKFYSLLWERKDCH